MARLQLLDPPAEQVRAITFDPPATEDQFDAPDSGALDPLISARLDSNLSDTTERRVKIAIVLAAFMALAASILSGKLHLRMTLLEGSRWADGLWYASLAYGACMYAVMVWRIVLWLRYKPMPSVSDAELPSLSVIIPAFNEGKLVQHSILSIARSDYPKDKLEIIAIDDGSADDTWLHIRHAAGMVDGRIRVTTFKQPVNKGKREALYVGFKQARGDVIITIDSDSLVEPAALRNGVTPLVRDPSIGCVAGCVEVLNPRQSLITRFLKCTFSLSFKFVRAYQSQFRGVFCTPGALSVYRAEIVRRVADEWVAQKFLGQTCTTGEDRAMTNLILREGWMTAYQGNAVVWSKMPHTYTAMCKMLLRWGRSNIRETIVLFKFLLTNFRQRYLRSFQFNMVLTALTLVLPPFLIVASYALMFTSPTYVLHQMGMLVIYGVCMSIIYYLNERDSDWVWLFLYEFIWPIGFAWIIPWSSVTLRNTAWLTRATTIDLEARGDRSPVMTRLPSPGPMGGGALQPAVAMSPS